MPVWPRIKRLISISEHLNYETQLLNILAVYEASTQRFFIYNKDLISFLSNNRKGLFPRSGLKEFVDRINVYHQKMVALYNKTNILLANDDNQRLFYFKLTMTYQQLLKNYLLFTQNNYLNQDQLKNIVAKTEQTFRIAHFKLLAGEPKAIDLVLSQLHHSIMILMGISDVVPFITTLLDDYIPDKLRSLNLHVPADDYQTIYENIMNDILVVKKHLYGLKYQMAAEATNMVLKKIYYYMNRYKQPVLTDKKADQLKKI